MKKVNAIIMASGYSKRMKKNKLLLKYKGKFFVEHTIDIISSCNFQQIILVAREEEILTLGEKKGVKVVKNKNAHKGISESIKLGVLQSKSADGYMFFTADQPLLKSHVIGKVLDKFEKSKDNIIIPCYKGKKGSPVIFPNKFKQSMLELQGDVGGKQIIRKNLEGVNYVEINDEQSLFDVDTIEDYEKILKWDGADDEI